LLFHGHNGYVNAPHCYIIHTLPVFPSSLPKAVNEFMRTFKRKVNFWQEIYNSCLLLFIHTDYYKRCQGIWRAKIWCPEWNYNVAINEFKEGLW